MDPKDFESFFRSINKFDELLGIDFDYHGPGDVTYHLKVEEKHCSSPGTCHGGVISGFMDAILGVTVLSYAVTQEKLCATVEFKVNYIQPARLGEELVGTGKIEHKGKRLVVASASINKKDSNELVARSMGTFNLYPISKKAF